MTKRFIYDFDWDIIKAMANWQKHGLSLRQQPPCFAIRSL
jgi:uncharacterized DUF497 family protein